MRCSYTRICVTTQKTVIIVPFATLKLLGFCLKGQKIIAVSQVVGHSVHFFVAIRPTCHGYFYL